MEEKKQLKDIPSIIEVNTEKYLKNLEDMTLKVLVLENDNKIYKGIIKAILSIKPEFFNTDLYLSLTQINEICKVGFQGLSKNLKKEKK